MIKIFESEIEINKIIERKVQSYDEFEPIVKDIIAKVVAEGDKAVLEYSRRFDCESLETLEVTKEEIDEAYGRVDPDFIKTLETARDNISDFHTLQLHKGFKLEKEDGIVMGQKYTPIEKVGIYVPGGTASYPSTVLMNAIPAKIAGVSQIVMTTPCKKDGKIKDEILAAAKICGVDKVFKCGGAQAVAALAYGTETIPEVDKIVGPGNIFVATAKRLVFGTVDIDMFAGPSEILVIADENANPAYVAADFMSQAEHDPIAASVLVTTSAKLVEDVKAEIEKQIKTLSRADIIEKSLLAYGSAVIVDNLDEAAKISPLPMHPLSERTKKQVEIVKYSILPPYH
jgi:histidinol dehydrogenase